MIKPFTLVPRLSIIALSHTKSLTPSITSATPRRPPRRRSPPTMTNPIPVPTELHPPEVKSTTITSNRPDFAEIEASRPDWDFSARFHFTKTPAPQWRPGDGPNSLHPASPARHIAIDPYAPDRTVRHNYKLLISTVVPRPIAFLSTRSRDGAVTNLAPFSFFNMVSFDPPVFAIGFSTSVSNPRDSLKLLLETEECVINIISESFLEAANACAVNSPLGTSEWALSGLTPAYDCETVACARVREAVFSIEGKLDSVREFESRMRSGEKSGTMVLVEGTWFWAREDAINEEKSMVDPAVLRPISRLGGISYGRTMEAVELPRFDYTRDLGGLETYEKLQQEKGD